MQYLIDTQILIWVLEDSKRLTPKIRTILGEANNEFWFSQFSLLEIGIKLKLNKLPDFIVGIDEFAEKASKSGLKMLKIENSHIAANQNIPLFEEHRDPFDRFLLATALSENLPIISADEKFKLYMDLIQLIEA